MTKGFEGIGAGGRKCLSVVEVAILTVAMYTQGGGLHAQEPVPFWLNGQEIPSYYEKRASGGNVAPAFEGWERNVGGTFNLVFGYFNRNWEEQPDVPIGQNNDIEPGGPDQGQPTHFFPRRNKLVFRVRVPKDFGNKEVVWTLTVNGKTERAYGTLKPDYILDKRLLESLSGAGSLTGKYDDEKADANTPPVITLEGDSHRIVKVGEPLKLSARVTDDGIFEPKALSKAPNLGDRTALGLRVAWFVYRGPADTVHFYPEQFKVYQDKRPGGNSPWSPGWTPPPIPPDNKFPVTVTFITQGTYTIRIIAHDGGLDATTDVTVTVTPK